MLELLSKVVTLFLVLSLSNAQSSVTVLDVIITWTNGATFTDFNVTSRINGLGTSNSWLAIGLNSANVMSGANTIVCFTTGSNGPNVQHLLNTGYSTPAVFPSSNSTVGLSNIAITLNQGNITYSFRRQNVLAISGYYSVTATSRPYIIVAYNSGSFGYHGSTRAASSSTLVVQSVTTTTVTSTPSTTTTTPTTTSTVAPTTTSTTTRVPTTIATTTTTLATTTTSTTTRVPTTIGTTTASASTTSSTTTTRAPPTTTSTTAISFTTQSTTQTTTTVTRITTTSRPSPPPSIQTTSSTSTPLTTTTSFLISADSTSDLAFSTTTETATPMTTTTTQLAPATLFFNSIKKIVAEIFKTFLSLFGL